MEYDTFPEMEVVSPHEPRENLKPVKLTIVLRVASLEKPRPQIAKY